MNMQNILTICLIVADIYDKIVMHLALDNIGCTSDTILGQMSSEKQKSVRNMDISIRNKTQKPFLIHNDSPLFTTRIHGDYCS